MAAADSPRASAPASDHPEHGNVVGTREQVIACLRLQLAFRRMRARRSREAGDGVEACFKRAIADAVAASIRQRCSEVGAVSMGSCRSHLCAANSDGHKGQQAGATQSAIDENQLAANVVVKDLDTGLAISLADIDMIYENAPLTTFENVLPPMVVPSTSSTSFGSFDARHSFAVALGGRQRGESMLGIGGGLGGEISALIRRDRRRGVHAAGGRAMQPLMCGPLLKRGKKLGQWKLRWYHLTFDGELMCHRQRGDVDRKPPLFSTLLGQVRQEALRTLVHFNIAQCCPRDPVAPSPCAMLNLSKVVLVALLSTGIRSHKSLPR